MWSFRIRLAFWKLFVFAASKNYLKFCNEWSCNSKPSQCSTEGQEKYKGGCTPVQPVSKFWYQAILENNLNLLCFFKAYDSEEKTFGGLNAPSQFYLVYVKQMEETWLFGTMQKEKQKIELRKNSTLHIWGTMRQEMPETPSEIRSAAKSDIYESKILRLKCVKSLSKWIKYITYLSFRRKLKIGAQNFEISSFTLTAVFAILLIVELADSQHTRGGMRKDKDIKGSNPSCPSVPFLFCAMHGPSSGSRHVDCVELHDIPVEEPVHLGAQELPNSYQFRRRTDLRSHREEQETVLCVLFGTAVVSGTLSPSGAFCFLIIHVSVCFLGRMSAAACEREILGAIRNDIARRFFLIVGAMLYCWHAHTQLSEMDQEHVYVLYVDAILCHASSITSSAASLERTLINFLGTSASSRFDKMSYRQIVYSVSSQGQV